MRRQQERPPSVWSLVYEGVDVHLGAMTGTVDIVLRCLTGMLARGDTLQFDPTPPQEVKNVRFGVHYRGHRVEVIFAKDHM